MPRNIIVPAVLAMLLIAAGKPSQADTIYYEPFAEENYPVDYLGTDPDIGGMWTAVVGAPNDDIVAGSLSTAGTQALPAQGGKLHFFGDDDARGYSTLDGSVGADGTEVWASFLIDFQGAPGTAGFTGLELRNASGTGTRVLGAGWDGAAYAAITGIGSNTPISLADDGVNFLVLRFDYVTGNDTVDVYVNPTASDLADGIWSDQLTGGDFSFGSVVLSNFNNSTNNDRWVDEVRIGTTLAEVAVVPEPRSLAMALCGMVPLLYWFGRRRSVPIHAMASRS